MPWVGLMRITLEGIRLGDFFVTGTCLKNI